MSQTINRIIIGDVGSGKTITAFLIGLSYLEGFENSGQVAMMAPTEVLAFQHYQSLVDFKKDAKGVFEKFSFEFDVIYNSGKSSYINGERYTPKKFSEYIQTHLKDKVFWIGTHALLFNEFVCADLVMVDEQHRFGVKQRQKLTSKITESRSGVVPHFLSFTATPIPRTLALTLYGELKPYFLETLKERTKIETSIDDIENLEYGVYEKIEGHINRGRKVFIICPRIEESEDEDDELMSVSKVYDKLCKEFGSKVDKVHGKISDKKDILKQFKEDESKNILVSTTVVEVGVDVSEASLMVILNAERFGLSALHQIRGRVGRNRYNDNECVLLTYKKYSRSKRLKYLTELNDGFELSKKDLEIRGAGDFLGRIQSGFGDEIDEIMGLDPELYEDIFKMVGEVDYKKLPRMEAFLKQNQSNIWGE